MSERDVGAQAGGSMEPTRDPRVTLPDLLEVLLNRGVYLNLDLIIAVADVPLIGVNLRATIAGMETMLEYGMMRSWDERTRAWVRRSVARHLPLADGEDVVARMAGGHYHEDFYGTWRPGALYLTTHRLIAYRRDPREILWQARLDDIAAVELHTERSIGGEDRTRLHVTTTSGERAVLSAAAPERLHDLVRQRTGGGPGPSHAAVDDTPRALVQGRMWFREDRAGSRLWRAGAGTLDATTGLTWKGTLDARPAVRLHPAGIASVSLEQAHSPLQGLPVLRVGADSGDVVLAVDDPQHWAGLIAQVAGTRMRPQVEAGVSR